MQTTDVRYLFAYDRWATTRILDAAVGIDEATWSEPNAIGERGLGGILVHALGAYQRWHHGLSDSAGEPPRLERGALPTVAGLRALWETEWPSMEAWLATLDDAALAAIEADGVPFWVALAHVVNHGTQHRAEAAALLTSAGHSPGDLDLFDYAESVASGSA